VARFKGVGAVGHNKQRIAPDVSNPEGYAMPDCRRAWQAVGTYFLTVNLLQRTGNDLLTRQVASLREVVLTVRNVYAGGAVVVWV
jgi:hypothetical protein